MFGRASPGAAREAAPEALPNGALLASPTAVAARARVEAGRRSGSVVEEEAGTTGKRENEEGSGSWEKMSKICDGGV